jgi:septal ring factor EnvC (AmiA/AmiB activator)
VNEVRRARLPWFLVAASVLLAVMLVYALLGAYIPAKRRVVSLEKELRGLYAQEAELHTKVAQNENRQSLRDQQLIAVTRERDELARRLHELEREIEAMRRR